MVYKYVELNLHTKCNHKYVYFKSKYCKFDISLIIIPIISKWVIKSFLGLTSVLFSDLNNVINIIEQKKNSSSLIMNFIPTNKLSIITVY